MSLKLKLGAAALGMLAASLAASLTAQTAFAAGSGAGAGTGAGASQAASPGSAGAIAVRCGVYKAVPHQRVVHPLCCPLVAVTSRLKPRQALPHGTLVSVFCCPAPFRVFPAPAPPVPISYTQVPGKGQPVQRLVVAAGCAARVLTFDAPAGGSVFTEVRGPRLAAHEKLFYRGRIYQVAWVSGKQFGLDFRGRLFRNDGPAIRDGRAVVLPFVVIWTVTPAPAKCRMPG